MKLNFQKLPINPASFRYKKDSASFSGSVVKNGRMKLRLEGILDGHILTSCDLCADEFDKKLNENLQLNIINQILENSEDLDTIEVLKDEVDLREIIDLEIENIKLDYNYCTKCNKQN